MRSWIVVITLLALTATAVSAQDPTDTRMLAQPAVTAPIIGPRTLDQLTSALRAPELTLDAEVLSRLDELFPGPGAAPEAYAW